MIAEKINLCDWDEYGVGADARAYRHKTDDTLLLKLNNKYIPENVSSQEYELSKAAYDMGIKCPETYKYVTDGERYGIVFQRILNKKSYCRLISENRSLIDVLSQKFASQAKQLHFTPCDTKIFFSHKDMYRQFIAECKVIPSTVKQTLYSYIDEMDNSTTCLHGDLHYGNLITAYNENYWIDLGKLGYGDPFFDLSAMYTSAKYLPAKYIENIFHVDRKTHMEFSDKVLQYYLGDDYNNKRIKKRIEHSSMLRLAMYIHNDPNSYFLFGPALKGYTTISRGMSILVNLAPIPSRLK